MRAQLHTVKGPSVSNPHGGEIRANDKIPDEKYLDLNLPGDQMFQRWLIDRIFHRKEMHFERGSLSPIKGFLTGIDSTSYSISTTTDFPPRSRIIPRHTVTAIEETGISLHEMDARIHPLIKRYTASLREKCERYLIPSKAMAAAGRDRVSQNSL